MKSAVVKDSEFRTSSLAHRVDEAFGLANLDRS